MDVVRSPPKSWDSLQHPYDGHRVLSREGRATRGKETERGVAKCAFLLARAKKNWNMSGLVAGFQVLLVTACTQFAVEHCPASKSFLVLHPQLRREYFNT